MKNLLFLLAVLAIATLECNAQKSGSGQVGPKGCGVMSIDSTMAWINKKSDTAVDSKKKINVNLADLLKDTVVWDTTWFEWAMRDQSYYRIVTLTAGTFYNTEWNPTTGKIESFLSKVDFTGTVRFFEWGSYKTSLYKEECWNDLFERSTDGTHATTPVANYPKPADNQNSGSQPSQVDQNQNDNSNRTFTKSSSTTITVTHPDQGGGLRPLGGGDNLYSTPCYKVIEHHHR